METSSFTDWKAAVNRTSPTWWPAASRYVTNQPETSALTRSLSARGSQRRLRDHVAERDATTQELAARQAPPHC